MAADSVAVGRLMAPPMSTWLHTVVFFWSGEKLYICPVYTWWISFETVPVTGSLVSVAANLCVAEFGTSVVFITCSIRSQLVLPDQ